MAETAEAPEEVKTPETEAPKSAVTPELKQQAEARRELGAKYDKEVVLEDEAMFDPKGMDEMVAEGIKLGGLVQKYGENGPTDPNFPGALVEGVDGEWAKRLEASRQVKGKYIEAHGDEVAAQFKLGDPGEQPIDHVNRRARELADAGLVKFETGASARPDSLVFQNRMLATSEQAKPLVDQWHNEARAVIRDGIATEIQGRLAKSLDKGTAAGNLVRDLMARGLIDVEDEVTEKQVANPKGGTTTKREVVGRRVVQVGDERVGGVSELYRDNIQALIPFWDEQKAAAVAEAADDSKTAEQRAKAEARSKLDHKSAFQQVLRGLDVAKLREEGAKNREALIEGANVEMAVDAREKLRNLGEADKEYHRAEARKDEDRLYNLPASEGGYADNIEAHASRMRGIRDEAHEMALQEDREAKAQSEIYEPMEAAKNERLERLQEQIDKMSQERGARKVLEDQRDALRKQLEAERDEAVNAEKARQTAAAESLAEHLVQATDITTQMIQHAKRGENMQSTTSDEASADAVRRVLDLDPTPERENNIGGLGNGPKIKENWYPAPHNDRLVVFERVNRNTGELVSQTIFSASEGLQKDKKGRYMPPASSRDAVVQIRDADLKRLKARPDTKKDGSTGIGDKVRVGFGADATDRPGGRYAKYASAILQAGDRGMPDDVAMEEANKQIAAWREKHDQMDRAGGFWNWAKNRGKAQELPSYYPRVETPDPDKPEEKTEEEKK